MRRSGGGLRGAGWRGPGVVAVCEERGPGKPRRVQGGSRCEASRCRRRGPEGGTCAGVRGTGGASAAPWLREPADPRAVAPMPPPLEPLDVVLAGELRLSSGRGCSARACPMSAPSKPSPEAARAALTLVCFHCFYAASSAHLALPRLRLRPPVQGSRLASRSALPPHASWAAACQAAAAASTLTPLWARNASLRFTLDIGLLELDRAGRERLVYIVVCRISYIAPNTHNSSTSRKRKDASGCGCVDVFVFVTLYIVWLMAVIHYGRWNP